MAFIWMPWVIGRPCTCGATVNTVLSVAAVLMTFVGMARVIGGSVRS